jgi:hypothetical protein
LAAVFFLYRFYYFETEYTSNDLLLCVSQNSRPIGNMGGGGLYKEKKDLYPSTYVDSTCQTSCVLSENYEGGGGMWGVDCVQYIREDLIL